MSHTLQALQPFVMHLLLPTYAVRLTAVTMESAKGGLQLTTAAGPDAGGAAPGAAARDL